MTKKKTNKDKVWIIEVNGVWRMAFSDKAPALAFLDLIDEHGISCGSYSSIEPIHSIRAETVALKRMEWDSLSYDEQKKFDGSYTRFRDGRPLSADEADGAATQ
jgi:hypothetical protein